MKKKNNGKLLIVLIIIIAIICAGIYIFTNNKPENNNEKTSNTENNNKEEVIEDNGLPKTPVDIEDDLVIELAGYIAPVNTSKEVIFYQSKPVKLENLDNDLKLYCIFENLDDENADKKESHKNENGNKVTHYYYKKETVEKMAKKIFGPDVKIEHKSCEMYFGEAIDYKDGMYDRHEYEGGGGTLYEKSFSVIVKAEKDDEHMYVYEKYAHIVEVSEDKDGETYLLGYDIYDSSDKTNKIAERIDFENDNINEEDEDEEIKDIEKFSGKNLVMYKHTFNKAKDGSYYWYSTNQVK